VRGVIFRNPVTRLRVFGLAKRAGSRVT